MDPYYMKKQKYMKDMIAITFFQLFIVFHVEGSIASIQHEKSLDVELNFTSNKYSHSKFD